ncbi:MAG TPA: hypothetical protein VHM72_05185 [Solirubrobacteraceae bacterium]|nr:hypothetical protein [Solirubrobacteraceae bacterium]
MSGSANVESLLREALSPVDPPPDLASRVTSRLQSISDYAADELESWELAAMRDPRNWLRPAIALLGGGAAGAGLVLLRAHQRHAKHADRGSEATPPGVDES